MPHNLLKQIQDHHTHVRTGYSAQRLGPAGTDTLLAGIRERASQWISFQARSMKRATFHPIPSIVDTLLLLPNLTTVELNFRITPPICQALIRLLAHPRLERLAIINHDFESNTLHTLLLAIKSSIVLPHSRLRHLCFASAITSATGKPQIAEDLLALLQLGTNGCGRVGGIEYLDLNDFAVFRKEHLDTLGDLLDMRNTTFQAIRLSGRDRYLLEQEGLDEEMRYNLVENRGLRRSTQRAAARPLPLLRGVYVRGGGGGGGLEAARRGVSLLALPEEILREIVSHLGTEPLTARQLSNLIWFAADRETIGGEKKADSRKEFLHRVDCWRYDA